MALGRLLLIAGIALAAAGLLVIALTRLGLPLGRLPGDMNWRGSNWRVSFPLATSLLFSVLLTLILYLVTRLRR